MDLNGKRMIFFPLCSITIRIYKQTRLAVHLFTSLHAERSITPCFYFSSDISELWLGKEKREDWRKEVQKAQIA